MVVLTMFWRKAFSLMSEPEPLSILPERRFSDIAAAGVGGVRWTKSDGKEAFRQEEMIEVFIGFQRVKGRNGKWNRQIVSTSSIRNTG